MATYQVTSYKPDEEEQEKKTKAASTPKSETKAKTSWYSGSQPTARETGAQVYRVGIQNPSMQSDLNRMFEEELDNPNGPIYQPYRRATSTSFTKTNVQNTQKAQAEWAGLQDELSYWAGRSDLNLSDDEIIGRIDWKKYSTLAKMDEQAAMGTPLALVDAVGYSKDAMYGALWAARNPGQSTGDAFLDSIQGQLGRGQQFKINDVNGWRDATSENYAPYKAGATALSDLAYKYRMDGYFDMAWLNGQGMSLLNGDEQMKKDYNTIYSVVSQTEKLDAELQRYREEVNSAIASGLDPRTVFYEGMMQEEYPELYKALEGQRSGKLVGTSRALDFDFDADVLAMQDAYQKKTGTMDDADFAADVSALLGVPTMGNEAQKAVTVQTNAQLQEAGSIFAKWFTPSEAGAMYTADAGYAPTKQQLAYSILNGTAGDNEAYASAMAAANAYAAEFWLNSVNKLKELENHLLAFDEYDALTREWDEVRNAENVDENARWEYEDKFAALETQKSVWESYESRDELVSAIENEKKIQSNTLKMFSDAERLNTSGQSSGSVMPLLTFVDAFGGYESVRYPNTEWGKAMSEGSDWATVSKSIAEQEKSNGVMLRMINTALKQAEQYGLGEDYTRGLIAARDDIVRENQLMQYDKMHGAKDFDSQVSAFDKSQMAAEPKFFYVHGSANDAEVYRAGIVDMEKALAAYGDDDTRLLYPGQMTDFEKETYKYLFMTQGEEAATGYVEALIPMLDVRYRQGVLEQADDATSTIAGTIGANALTVLGNLTGVFSLASNAISSLTGEEVDPYSPTFSLSAFSGRVRENTRKAIGEDNPWVVAYDAAMAAADSLTAAFAGGGSKFIALALQSGNAANASLMEAKMRGASDQQAWMYAGASAAAEALTEAGPVGNLLDAYAKGGTKAFKEVLMRQMIAEGLGELGSEILNTVADNVIMQELSQYNASVEQYMAEGYTEEAAKSMAATDVVANVFYSGMLGSVSAAPSVSASYAAGTFANRKQNLFKSRAETALSKAQSDGAGKPAQAAAMAAAMETGGSAPEDADAAASAMVQTDPQATYTLWSILDHSTDFDAIPAVELGALVPDSQTGNLFALIKEEGATDENVAQLIETAQHEMSDPAVKARYDAAIASYAEGMATMTAMVGADLSGIKNAQRNAENAGRTLQTARTSLENARASMKSASTVLQNAQKRFSNDHGDKATAAVIKAKERYQKAQQTLEGAKQTEENARKDYDAAKVELETMKQNTLAEIRQQGVTARDQIMANRQAVQEQKAAEADAKRQSDNVAAMEADNFVEDNYADAPDDKKAELRDQYIGQMPKRDMEGFKSGVELLSRASRKFGFKMQIVDDLYGAEGGYLRDENTIYVTKDITQTEAIKRVLLHEMTHAAEGAGQLYTEMRDALLSLKYHGNQTQLDADVNALMKDYNAFYKKRNVMDKKTGQVKQLTREQAMQELTANINAEIISGNQELIEQLVSESPSAARRIMNNIKNAIAKMLGVRDPMLDQARKVVGMFEQALGEAKKNGAVSSDGEMQFALSDIDYQTKEYYNRYGWLSVNDVMSYAERHTLENRLSDLKNGTVFDINTKGRLILDVGNEFGVNNVVVIAKKSYVNPAVERVYRINFDNETDIEYVRDVIHEYEQSDQVPRGLVDETFANGLVETYERQDFDDYETLSRVRGKGGQSEGASGQNRGKWVRRGNVVSHVMDDDLQLSLPKTAIDKSYMNALENGDEESAIRILDQAAEKAGYVGLYYHGTDAFGFTEFDLDKMDDGQTIFLSKSPEVAGTYTRNSRIEQINDGLEEESHKEPSAGVYQLYANLGRKLVVDGNGKAWDELSMPPEMETDILSDFTLKNGLYGEEVWEGESRYEYGENLFFTTREIADWAKKNGYDSVEFRNIVDYGHNHPWGKSEAKPADIIAIFNPSSVKSADLITYDDNGNIIPLSERFDRFETDIRFSLPSTDIINRQMAAYRESQQMDIPDGMGQRQFAGQTVQNSSAVPEEYKPTFMMPENLLYAKDTNREQVERAWQRIQQNGFESEYNRLLEKEDVYDADDVAEANLMMAMALNPNTSDPAVFMSLALRYNEKGTENSQALQARQLFKKMTPTGAQVWVAGKAEKDLKERRRTHQPEAKMVDDAAQVVVDSIKDKQGGDELLRLTSGGDFTIDASNNKWGIPLNEQQKALIDQYDLNDVNRPGLFYNRATVKQRMLEAIIATPNPLEVTGLGLNLIQRLEHMKRGEAVVTNADLNYIGARMAEFIGAGEEAGGRAAELALARAYEAYGNIKPATGWEKIRAQRYTNMLLSAPSVIRNVIGNALQNTLNAAAHGAAVEVDKIISKFTGKRTLDHLTVKERADGWAAFVEETKNTFLDYYVDRANTAPNREKYSTSQRGRVFNNGIQEGMRNLENFLMSVGDRNVWKKAFVNSLAEQQRLADQGLLFNTDGTTMTHEQMVEQAEKDANYATFTEDNAVQELMGAIASKHPAIADVISVYLPFTGVPSNIVKRSLQFSPVGLAYTIGKWGFDKATHKNFDQRTFVNNLSRGLTGTGLMVVGALLAKFGMIKLGTEDEDGNKAYDAATAMGEQYTPYVYDPITDTYVSMSTFAPALSPLVWGTAAMESMKGDEDAANALLNSLMYSTDSIFDASYLSGFSDIFNSQGSFTENLINTGLSNITSQTVPAFITQLANATDPYVRNTKDKDKLIEMLKVTANKIPGLRQALPEKVDVAGDTVRTKGWWSFIDPFTRTNPSYNEALIEANRLYDLTGDTSVLPSDLLRSRTNTLNVGGGKKLILENADKEWYQKRYGEIWTTALMELMRSPKYARMDDDERAEALKKILSDAMSQAKKEAWEKYGEE